jgi:hypothetical protein
MVKANRAAPFQSSPMELFHRSTNLAGSAFPLQQKPSCMMRQIQA